MDIYCWRKTVFKYRFGLTAPLLIAFAFAGSAQAHTKLVSSSPAANATVAKPGKIILNFNEKLIAAFVKTSLNMTGMPGMVDHPMMPVTGYTSAMSKDGKTLTLTMRKALSPGTYQLKWSAAGADTHRMTGTLTFTAK
jgi:methionine-rich copper-binding protein CopC